MTTNPTPRVSRRRFLTGASTAAAAIAVPVLLQERSAVAAQPTASMAATSTTVGSGVASTTIGASLALGEIQGNIIGGFNKDHQALLFVALPAPTQARAWLQAVAAKTSSSQEVMAFNAAFKAAVARNGSEVGAPTATWLNVALTFSGLTALGGDKRELDKFPREFQSGMAARADAIGDQGPNAPQVWPAAYRRTAHAVVILAADRPADLNTAVAEQHEVAKKFGVDVLFVQRGETRSDQPGHEHFGFKDGISQPGIRGVTVPSDPAVPDKGIPGQDLLWPGEFVLGYPRQAGAGFPLETVGPVATSGPAWTANGSYLVYRRLSQDVAGFRSFMTDMAKRQGVTEDLMGAKLEGRYKSGAPLEATGMQNTDPSIADPSLVSDLKVNDFEFGDDPDGDVVPLASHIRKSYPRDEETREGGESDTQTHRLLRRGIPFGASLPKGVSASDPTATAAFPDDRGLLFLCYQTSIERQFEFVQQKWVNDPNFPRQGAGHDPIISQVDGTRQITLPGGRPDHVALMQRFVTTTGGDYFFQPSLSALKALGVAPVTPPTTPTPTAPAPNTSRPATSSPATTAPPASAPRQPARPPAPTPPPTAPLTALPTALPTTRPATRPTNPVPPAPGARPRPAGS